MKKLLLILALILSCQMVASAQTLEEKIYVNDTALPPAGGRPRSVTISPEVYLNRTNMQLGIKFYSTDSYTLKVLDAAKGSVICQLAVTTDGIKHPYVLPYLENVTYTVIIESNNNCYEGEINL